jgi:glutamine amidotransferase
VSTGIVDCGTCNLDSIARAVQECGGDPVVFSKPEGLARMSRVILPGVGSFRHGIATLRERGFEAPLREVVDAGVPLLGICLGMQFLATRSWEGGESPGLGIIPGDVQRFESPDPSFRIPHMGWNEVRFVRPSPLFEGIPDGADFYFVHSYRLGDSTNGSVIGRTAYGGSFVSAIEAGRVFGVQFHPEKSQQLGFRLLRNFLAI